MRKLIYFSALFLCIAALGHVQIVVNIVDFGMNIQEAGDAPRMLHEGSSEPTGEIMTYGCNLSIHTARFTVR
jgi:gamma-glutamyltranspeptidase/glutathione hydrolase